MSAKIWEAFGPNYDDVGGPPRLGVFQGEKEDVIDWVDTNHPGFRDQLQGRKYPAAELREVTAKSVNRQMVDELRVALKRKQEADEALKRAKGA